jgi:uncharacterized protein with GYD domain
MFEYLPGVMPKASIAEKRKVSFLAALEVELNFQQESHKGFPQRCGTVSLSNRVAAEEHVNVYVVLLRRMEGNTRRTRRVSLEPAVVGDVAKSSGVELLDIVGCAGIFEAVLLCRAPDNRTVARLLDAFEGWYTDTLLATSHVRFVGSSTTASTSGL